MRRCRSPRGSCPRSAARALRPSAAAPALCLPLHPFPDYFVARTSSSPANFGRVVSHACHLADLGIGIACMVVYINRHFEEKTMTAAEKTDAAAQTDNGRKRTVDLLARAER